MARPKLSGAVDALAISVAKGDYRSIGACVERLYRLVERHDETCRAVLELRRHSAELEFAIREDIPLPLRFYKAWGGRATLHAIASTAGGMEAIGAKKDGKKWLLRPSDFANAIRKKYPQFTYTNPHV